MKNISICKDAIEVSGTIICRRELRPCGRVDDKDCPKSDKYEDKIEALKKIFQETENGFSK